jgi:hypothetical protein
LENALIQSLSNPGVRFTSARLSRFENGTVTALTPVSLQSVRSRLAIRSAPRALFTLGQDEEHVGRRSDGARATI